MNLALIAKEICYLIIFLTTKAILSTEQIHILSLGSIAHVTFNDYTVVALKAIRWLYWTLKMCALSDLSIKNKCAQSII